LLIRGVGLRGAVAINTITMIGIGPLITIPLVLGALHGPLSLVGWIAGAVLALCDGLVWAELGFALPRLGRDVRLLAGGVRAHKAGALLSFLFVWQTIVSVPLLQASGYIGFRQLCRLSRAATERESRGAEDARGPGSVS